MYIYIYSLSSIFHFKSQLGMAFTRIHDDYCRRCGGGHMCQTIIY
jgi:hypothetical protein